ncbi:hypothetical protein AC579_4262 [Pseudocercospora musae]|uniref:Uncharacterized protein n=1 Tax=Pseudocercospora musae TaxID=113226 RepID=A0A139I769_9PEZI|nr:hypothetical protein AC579_4262 [Pseudocercospora musae]
MSRPSHIVTSNSESEDNTSIVPSDSDSAMSEISSSMIEQYDHPRKLHDTTPAHDRYVFVFIKDHADTGTGMEFKIRYLDAFFSAFSHFKVLCCKICKPINDLRFKIGEDFIEQTDTPEELGLLHNTTTQIKVFSTISGLMCRSCKSDGYPTTEIIVENPEPFFLEASNYEIRDCLAHHRGPDWVQDVAEDAIQVDDRHPHACIFSASSA